MPEPKRILTAALLALGTAIALGPLTGCGTGVSPSIAPVPVTIAAGASGVFMGGQQPVGNINIQLYAANTAGYGSASFGLLTPGATKTTPSGNFTLPSFSCPSASSELYIVGTGGNPIVGQPANPNLALMAALGTCQAYFSSSNFINVNELTTVATVYALSPFMTGYKNIGSLSSNQLGLANAAAVVNQVVNTTNGTIPGPTLPAGTTLPVAELNTLADILEQCVNSAGGTASDTSTGCGKLFSLTTVNGVAPTDTITAMLNIAKNPTLNVAALNNLRSASPVFIPVLSVNSPPNDWTVAITYAPAGLSTPTAIATDASGSVWVTNKGTSSVTKLDATGTQTFNVATSYSSPSAIAIDPNGNAWITNAGNNTLALQSASGGSPTIYTGNGLTAPKAVAIDGLGNVIVTNTSSVSTFTSSGAALNSPYTGVSSPVAAVPTPR